MPRVHESVCQKLAVTNLANGKKPTTRGTNVLYYGGKEDFSPETIRERWLRFDHYLRISETSAKIAGILMFRILWMRRKLLAHNSSNK